MFIFMFCNKQHYNAMINIKAIHSCMKLKEMNLFDINYNFFFSWLELGCKKRVILRKEDGKYCTPFILSKIILGLVLSPHYLPILDGELMYL